MNWPPMLLALRFRPRPRWLPGLWLPLGLLWPLVGVLLIPVLALGGVLALVMGHGRTFVRVVAVLYGAVCALRGVRIDVADSRHRIFIHIW